MGNALKDMGDYNGALESIDRALALAPNFAGVLQQGYRSIKANELSGGDRKLL